MKMIGKFSLMSRRSLSAVSTIKQFYHQHCVSQLFQPQSVTSRDTASKNDEMVSLSHRLLIDNGIIQARGNGMFALLPLGQRALAKLSEVIDEEMKQIGGQKLTLPTLTAGYLWKLTGRWESTGDELMKVKDRHGKEYVLSPTFEEAIVHMMSEVSQLTHHQFPLHLYQISNKVRDEANPRFGILRCKEFLMKDLYTFDKDEASAVATYDRVSHAYDAIFQRLRVPYIKVAGDCGNIGGSFSHEYHYTSAVGQDTLLLCENCGTAVNSEMVADPEVAACATCGEDIKRTKGFEVGHTFLLGTKYTNPLKCYYLSEKSKQELVHMGCYGIGISRLLAAAVEVLSEGRCITWPWIIAPYKVCLIGPKRGSKEAKAAGLVDFLAKTINSLPHFQDDVIVDDRDTLTIGKRMVDAKKTGYPIIIVVGKTASEIVPRFEVIEGTDKNAKYFSHSQLINYLRNR